MSVRNTSQQAPRDLRFTQPPEACHTIDALAHRVVNNQLSGAQKAQIDYLYRLSNYLYQFNYSLIR